MNLKKHIGIIFSVMMVVMSLSFSYAYAESNEQMYNVTAYGHSGGASGIGLFLGAIGNTNWENGTPDRAPFISGVTGNNSVAVATTRVGALEFSIDKNIDPETVVSATMQVYVNSINQNFKSNSDWMLLAAYETNNPTLSYSVGGMDAAEFAPVNDDYSYRAAMWSNEQCSKTNLGWKTIDIKRAVIHALENSDENDDAVRVVIRLHIPACGLNVSIQDNVPAVTIKTNDTVSGVIKTVDQNGKSILPDRNFASGAGEFSYYEKIIQELTIDDTLYYYDENASTTKITLDKNHSNEIILVYNNTDEIRKYSGDTLIENGATCWFADPRSIKFEHDDIYENNELVLPACSMTIVGAIDDVGTVKAVQYNHLTNNKDDIIIDTGFEADDHNNPTFLYLPDHRIMVFWSKHTAEEYWYYRVTTEPDDLTTLGEEKKVSVAGYGNYTYPSAFYMSDAPDSFFMCWRGINWHPTIAKYSLPDENGDITCEINPTQLVQTIGQRPYVKYESNGKDKIYFTFTTAHPDNNYPNWVYYAEIDINTLNLYDIEGNLRCEVADLPYGKDDKINTSSDYGSLTVDAPTNKRDWVWDIAKDSTGAPVILLTEISNDKSQHDYYYAKWNAETKVWEKTYIANGGGWFHQNGSGLEKCYSGGMCLDHSDPSIVYVSKPTAGLFGTIYEIWELKMNGTSIESENQITENSRYNNVRPFVTRGSSQNDKLRLTWMNGLYYYWVSSASLPNAYPTSIMTYNNENSDISLDVAVNKTDSGVEVSISKNNIDDTAAIIITGYTAEGRMADVKISADSNVVLEGEDIKYVKAFCFENLETLKPLTPACYKEITE